LIQENFSLNNHNTFGVDISAKYFAEVNSVEDLVEILKNHQPTTNDQQLLLLGGGSNILFTQNFDGLVIQLNLKGISKEIYSDNEILITSKAGENWHELVQYCLSKNYGGLENLSLIPGNVGTSPMQNIGAYGVEIKDTFVSCKVLNLETLEVEVFDKEKCDFGYRDSIFKKEGKGKYVILEVTFKLTTKDHKIKTEYGAIKVQLEEMGIENPTIQNVSKAIIAIRESKLPNPKVTGNAGSFFKNPTISKENYLKLKENFDTLPGYPNENGIKVPAGWLIEKSGWKGKQIGNVASHKDQSLVIINSTGNATGKEIYDFSQMIIDSVQEKFRILLEREVNII
jgi:UDP-N-acetylmuramate dehydrogenase